MGKGLAGVFLFLALLPAAQGEELWRHVDEQGVIRYSDRPFKDAVEVQLPGSGRWWGEAARSSESSPAVNHTAAAREGPFPELAIVRPAEEETVRGVGGELEVVLAMEAPPEDGRLVLELDGAEAVWLGSPPYVRLTQVWRGEHRLRARLLDADNRELAASQEVRFYKREPSSIKASAGSP